MASAFEQLRFLGFEMYLFSNRRWWRYWTCLFDGGFQSVACYRIDRALYLAFGSVWAGARMLLAPVFLLLSPWVAHCDIHYQSNIGKGLKILHHSLGIVISKYTVIGSDCTLTGGICFGSRKGQRVGIRIGNNLTVGANATILGPVTIGDNVIVGAGAVVLNDIPSGAAVGGVPAKVLSATPNTTLQTGHHGIAPLRPVPETMDSPDHRTASV